MKKLLASLLMTGFAHAGVFVMIESPHVTQLVQDNKKLIAHEVAEFNAQVPGNKQQLAFEPDKWDAHITLDFIDQDAVMKAQDAEKKYHKLEQNLRLIAKKSSPINITQNIEESRIAYWPGAAPMMLGGSKKQNYVTVVLKLGDNKHLADLADRIARLLEAEYGIKQRFPFSAHLTLGRIYEVNDNPVMPIVPQLTTEPHVESIFEKINVHAFKLKGAGGSEIEFPFGPKHMMKRHQKPLETYQ